MVEKESVTECKCAVGGQKRSPTQDFIQIRTAKFRDLVAWSVYRKVQPKVDRWSLLFKMPLSYSCQVFMSEIIEYI